MGMVELPMGALFETQPDKINRIEFHIIWRMRDGESYARIFQ